MLSICTILHVPHVSLHSVISSHSISIAIPTAPSETPPVALFFILFTFCSFVRLVNCVIFFVPHSRPVPSQP